MNQGTVQELNCGYNRGRNRTLKLRRWVVIGVKCLPWALISIILVYSGLLYLANTPRERAKAKYSFWQRVLYGIDFHSTTIRTSLSAPEDNPKKSKLQIFEIYLRGEKVNSVTSHLPQSGKVFQSGLFRVKLWGKKDLVYKAKVRLRGDSMNHWAFPQKSWRVKLKKGSTFEGIRTFNLYLPRSKSQIPDFMGYWMAEQMGGLVVPKAYPVHFRFNRRFDGVRVFLEQVNEDFLSQHNLPGKTILVGDVDATEIYSSVKRERLFESSKGWEVITSDDNNPSSPIHRQQLDNLIALIAKAGEDPQKFSREVGRFIDVDETLRYMAFLEIVNSKHVDETHNQKFFLDSSKSVLRPIVWDPVAYYWDDPGKLDLASNKLFAALLLVPEFRDKKNQFIWQALQGPLALERVIQEYRSAIERIRSEVLGMPIKIHTESNDLHPYTNAEWREATDALMEAITKRYTTIRNLLHKVPLSAKIRRDKGIVNVDVEIIGDPGFLIQEFRFRKTNGSSLPSSIVVRGPDSEQSRTVEWEKRGEDLAVLSLSQILYSQREFKGSVRRLKAKPGIYTYSFDLPVSTGVLVEIFGKNTVTEAEVTVIPEDRDSGSPRE
jgi:hypothetical protein